MNKQYVLATLAAPAAVAAIFGSVPRLAAAHLGVAGAAQATAPAPKIYAASSDGTTWASVEEKGVTLNSRAGGATPVVLNNTGSRVTTALAFSQDGTMVAVASDDRTIRIFQAKTGKQLREVKVPSDNTLAARYLQFRVTGQAPRSNIVALAFHTDGKQLVASDIGLKGLFRFETVSAATEDTPAEWGFKDARPTPVPITSIASDGRDGWVGGDGAGAFHFYDYTLLEIGTTPSKIAGAIRTIEVLPAAPGRPGILASGGDDGEVKLWRFTNANVAAKLPATFVREKRKRADAKTLTPVASVAFRNDGKTVLFVDRNGRANEWDLTTDPGDPDAGSIFTAAVNPPKTDPPKTDPPRTDPDPPKTDPPKTDPPKTDPPKTDPDPPKTDPPKTDPPKTDPPKTDPPKTDPTRVVKTPPPVRTGPPIIEKGPVLIGHSEYVNTVAFSPNGQTVASGARDKTIRLWDASTGAVKALLGKHNDYVASVHFSPDGKTLVSGGWDNQIKLWNVAEQQEITNRKLNGHKFAVLSVDFDRKGQRLVSGSNDKTARLWYLTGTNAPKTTSVLPDAIAAVCFSPDGSKIIGGGLDGKIYVWDAATMKLLRTLPGTPTQKVFTLVCLNDELLVAGGQGGFVKVWNYARGAAGVAGSTLLAPNGKDTFSVAYNARKKILVAGGADRLIRVWYINDPKVLAPSTAKLTPYKTLQGHKDTVRALTFSEDGGKMASGGWDYNILVWNITTPGGTRVTEAKP